MQESKKHSFMHAMMVRTTNSYSRYQFSVRGLYVHEVFKMAEAYSPCQTAHHDKVDTKITDDKGKGLFAKCLFKEGDQILVEKPLISCQFAWNKLYKYTACDHCLKSLETAENMARRLSRNTNLKLMHKECCETEKSQLLHCKCPSCDVSRCLYCPIDLS